MATMTRLQTPGQAGRNTDNLHYVRLVMRDGTEDIQAFATRWHAELYLYLLPDDDLLRETVASARIVPGTTYAG